MMTKILIDFGIATVMEKRVRTQFVASNYLILNRLNIEYGTLKFNLASLTVSCIQFEKNGMKHTLENIPLKDITFLISLTRPKKAKEEFHEQMDRIIQFATRGFIHVILLVDKVGFTLHPQPLKKRWMFTTRKNTVPVIKKSTNTYKHMHFTSYMYTTLLSDKDGKFDIEDYPLPFPRLEPEFRFKYSLRQVRKDPESYCSSTVRFFENINTGTVVEAMNEQHAAQMDLPLLDE